MKKIILSMIAILLALASSLLAPMQTFAAANTKYYIEEIILVSTQRDYNAEDIVNKQYQVINTPIYDGGLKGTDESGRWKRSFLCYKVTTDPSKAITDIKALNMNAQWDYDAYNQRLAQIKVEVAEEADALAEAVYEFQNNYGDEKPKSTYVYQILQYLYDNKSGSRLGSLFADLDLMSTKNNDKDKLVNILLMGNAQCINVIYNALTLSCSETNNYNFLDIISEEGFNANTYAKETQYASMAQDIIDTINVTQEELRKYERSLNDEEANVFSAPTDAKVKAVYDINYDMVKDMMAEDRNGAGIFDQYIKLVLGKDPATLTPAERRMMIETGLVNVTWYGMMESQNFTSMQDVYGYMPTVISMFQNKKITADAYKEKVDQEIDSHKTWDDIPEYFIDYLTLYNYDFGCYNKHLLDIAESRTGERLAKILHSCAYHGYNNEYQDLYDLVMAHDMTVPEGNRNGKYELSDFYPIIAQLSSGQRGMLKTGLLNLILSVDVDEEEYKKSFETLQETIKELANGECIPLNGNTDDPCYSIYTNTDESLFEENSGVAMMKSAIENQKEYSYASNYGIIFACIGTFGGAVALGSLTTAAIANDIAASAETTMTSMVNRAWNLWIDKYGSREATYNIFKASPTESEVAVCQSMLEKEELSTLQAASAKSAIANTVCKVFTYVLAIAMIVLTIVMTTLAIMSMFVPIGSNDYLEIPRAICTERDICTYMVNLDNTVSVNRDAKGLVYYYGVKNPYLTEKDGHMYNNAYIDSGEDPSGNDLTKYQVADVANWSQTSTERQWIALYTTKDIRAGQPILADSLVIDGNSLVTNANTVSIFDESKPCNMQYYLKGASGRYLHFKVDESYNPYKAAQDKVNGNTAASVFAEPVTYVVGGATLIIGFGAGCGITVFAQKKRKNENA